MKMLPIPDNKWGRDLIRVNRFSKVLIILGAGSVLGVVVAQRFELDLLVRVFETVLWAAFVMMPIVWFLLRRLTRQLKEHK